MNNKTAKLLQKQCDSSLNMRLLHLSNIVFFVVLVLLSCTPDDFHSGQLKKPVPKVYLEIAITNMNQMELADSLLNKLTSRLAIFSNEYNRFVLVNRKDSADLTLNIKIRNMNLIKNGSHEKFEKERADSVDKGLGAKIIAANVIANVIVNTTPFMPGGIIIITLDADSIFTSSGLKYEARFTNKVGKKIWAEENEITFELNYVANEKEQQNLLARNTVIWFEEKFPLFETSWSCWGCRDK